MAEAKKNAEDGLRSRHVGIADKAFDEANRSDKALNSRGSAFSASFFAGIVLACDVFGIALCGLASYLLYSGDWSHGFLQHAAAVALFGLLTVLSFNTTGLYHFAAIVEPARHIPHIAVTLLGIFLLLLAFAVAFDVSGLFSLPFGLAWIAGTV